MVKGFVETGKIVVIVLDIVVAAVVVAVTEDNSAEV